MSDDILPLIYEPFGGQYNIDLQGWVLPGNITELPTIVLPVGTFEITLAPNDLISFKANDVIFGAVQSRGSNSVDVFGDVWLCNVYAIYDLATTGTPRFRPKK